MTYSAIDIHFNEDFNIGSVLSIDGLYNNGYTQSNINFNEKWFNVRASSNQVSTETPTSTVGESTAIKFTEAFEIDYNQTGIYQVTRTGNRVLIKCTDPHYTFNTFNADNNGVSMNVSVVFVNTDRNFFQITDISFSEATNPCKFVKVEVTTNQIADFFGYIINGVTVYNSSNTENPFSFEIVRETPFKIKCSHGGETILTDIVTPINRLGTFDVSTSMSPTGVISASAINVSTNIAVEFSIDGINWRQQRTFSNLTSGSYTMIMRDSYGCTNSKSFIINNSGITSPYFLISDTNSIQFVNRIAFGDCSNYKNDKNTLSCEMDVDLPYKEIQQFQACDVITTQFKSNYSQISALVIDELGNETELNIEQKTNNIGLTDMRDAFICNLGNGKSGIYFTTGNLYDYTTGIDSGNDYVLNGGLPRWAVYGNNIRIGQNWFGITGITFDDSRNVEMLVVDNIFTGADTVVSVASLYNLFNYEVYEFSIDFADYIDKKLRIKILNNDTNFDNLEHLSELIHVKTRQENTVEIRYKNKHNTDIFYHTGIEHKIRILLNKKNAGIEEESDTYKTDTSAILLNSEIYKVDEFIFEPMTRPLMYKVVKALSHSDVFINGIKYVKSGSIEVEGQLEESNLYIVRAKMINAGNIYNSQIGESSNVFGSGNSEIPRLIDSGDGYVTY